MDQSGETLSLLAESGERLPGARISSDVWEEIVTDPVAWTVIGSSVARVFDPVLAASLEPGHKLSFLEAEERAIDPCGQVVARIEETQGGNGREPERTGAPKEAEEQGLQIVIPMMGEEEERGSELTGALSKDLVSGRSRPALSGSEVRQAMDLAGQAQVFAKSECAACLRCGLGPQAVIHMDGVDRRSSSALGPMLQEEQERTRIHAMRETHDPRAFRAVCVQVLIEDGQESILEPASVCRAARVPLRAWSRERVLGIVIRLHDPGACVTGGVESRRVRHCPGRTEET